MASDDEASLRKHRRSPEEGSEEGLKRRKHHDSHHRHHHSHRHRHRNRSKRESDDLPPPVTTTSSFRPDNDEKEEGEILEEEEYHDSGGTGGEDRLKKADSDIESGEIKPDEAVAEISPPKSDQATESKEEDYSYSSVAEERMNDDMARNLAVETVDQLRECSYSKGVKLLRNESDESMANENEHIDKESLRHNNSKNSSIEVEESIDFDTPSDMKAENLVSGKLDELRIGCKSSGSKEKQQISPDFYEGKWHRRSMSPWDGTLRHVNGDMDHRPYKGDPRRVGSRSPPKGTGRDKKYKRHASSRSPVARGSLYSSKHRKREDDGLKVENPRNSEQNLEKYESRRHSESIENSLANKNRSASPLNSRDKYSSMGRHSSIEKYGREVHNRNGSSSRDHAIETVSQSRDTLHDRGFRQAARSHERDYSDNGDRAKRSNSRENKKNGSDREKVGRYEKEGRCDSRNRTADVENDRASTRERERSTNYGRHFGRDERHGSLDRDRDRGRDRERESDRNRERDRDRGREREKGRDNDRDRDREMERDRISRRHKYDSFENSYGGRDRYKNSRHQKYDGTENHRDQKRSKDSTKEEPRSTRHDLEERKEKLLREEDEQEDYRERVTLQLAEQEEEEVDRIKEESRKRRQAILEKYRQQQSHLQVESHSDGLGKEEKESLINGRPIEHSFPLKGADNTEIQTLTEGPENRHDMSDVYVVSSSFSVGKSPPQNGNSAFERTAGAGGLGDGTPKSERSADMFCDDIFGESPAGIRKSAKGDGLIVDRSGLHDNWDDAEGYYSYRFGEVLDGRYEVTAAHGKGVFSTVVRAKDLKAGKGDPEEVAIKIIRNNDTMYKAGLEELIILKKLVGADPEDKRHCVRFLSNFKYRNHLCLVFESLHMNLREVLKKFGRNIGLKLTAVRAYAKQLFIGLKHLRNCGVLHCDIKPDNMLVNEAKNVLKLCDFGNAMFAGKNEITPYLVSRFYRAPEIILGLPYDHPMDIWSVGCCLYELYSGKVLFPGPSNNDMLRLHMELKGSFPKKMLRKGAFTDQHFDQDLNFHATEEDPVTKKTVKRLIFNIKPKDISTLIASAPGEDLKMLASFKDLLERIFVLDPEKRLTVSQALSHPFITGK